MRREVPGFERIAERFARRLAGGTIHPGQLMAEVRGVVLEAVRDGVMPNQVVIALHPDDYEEYEPATGELRAAVGDELGRLERERNYRRIGRPSILIGPDGKVPRLSPAVSASFVNTEHRKRRSRIGETRRMHPLKGWSLVIDNSTRVPLPFLPFRIGRGADNDLVLPSPSVSRQHAELLDENGTIVLEDLGSRNGTALDGEQIEAIEIYDGDAFTLGDVALRIERRA